MAQGTRTKGKDASKRRRDETLKAFHDLVNMTPARIETWLKTEESRSVGRKPKEGAESVGHASGRRIVTILRKKKAEYDDDDLAHMRKVRGYIKRHLKQRPEGDVTETRWRYSLMNWGHDPVAS